MSRRIIQLLLDGKESYSRKDVKLGCPLNNIAQEIPAIDEGFDCRIDVIYRDCWQAIAAAPESGIAAAQVRKEISLSQTAGMIVAALEGCIGMAKTIQSLKVLFECGAGAMNFLEILELKGCADE